MTTTTATPLCVLSFTVDSGHTTTHTIPLPGQGNSISSFFVEWAATGGRLTLSAVSPSATSTCVPNSTTVLTSCSPTKTVSASGTPFKNSTCPSHSNSTCPSHSNSGLATSSSVGLAFGCLFAGAILALALGLFCFRRRKAFVKHSLSKRKPSVRSQGGDGMVPLAPSSLNNSTNVLEKLPTPITRTQFQQEASQWNTNIKNYLDNHADLAIDLSMGRGQALLAIEQLSALAGYDAPWHRLLRDKASRYNAMRMLVARVIANRVNPETAVDRSLLPHSVLRTYQDMVAGQKQDRNELLMQGIWRAMTMTLVSTTYQTSNAVTLAASPKCTSIQETAKVIHDALSPLLLRSEADSEVHSLVDVVAQGTLLGLRMFEQSNPTRFFWHTGEEPIHQFSRESFIVFPGIRQRKMQLGTREPIRRHDEFVIVDPIRA